MKQFLKSTAVFACVALLFCACGDDGTEDAVTSADLGVTSIRVVNPGSERAWVKWTVPSVSSIASCELSWTSDVGESGSLTYEAVEGIMETNKDTDLNNLPSGQYTFSIKSISKSGVSSVASSQSEFIYDNGSYTQRPSPSLIMMDDYGASIMWSNIPADCVGVTLNYLNESGVRADSELFPVSADTPVILSDAAASSMFTYTTHFKPNEGLLNEGLDEVVVENDDTQDYIFPSSSPTAPLSVSTRPGKERFAAYWIVPYVADIVSSRVEYDNGTDKVVLEVKGSDLNKGAAYENTLLFTDVPAGEYTVTVYNVKNTGDVSEGTSAQVVVYDQYTYPTGAKVKQNITLSGAGQAEIAWDYSGVTEGFDDCLGVIASAARGVQGSTAVGTSTGDLSVDDYFDSLVDSETLIAEVPAWSYISDVQEGDIIGYNTYFRPEDGLDYVIVAGSETESGKYTVPEDASPDKPYDVDFIPGDYSIFLEFYLTSDSSISSVFIEYVNVADATNTKIIEIEKDNLKFGRDNFASITTIDGLKLDAKYDIKIWSETTGGMKSAYELGESILVYDYAIFQSGCATPTFAETFGTDYPYGLTMIWDVGEGNNDVDNVKFNYVYNTAGESTTLTIYDLSVPTIISNAMPGNNYTYEATCIPAPNAMDNYTLPTISGTFPYVKVDKSLIVEYPMPGDATMDTSDEYTSFSSIFNGEFSLATSATATAMDTVDKYLTTTGMSGMTLSYDLGATYNLAEFYYSPYYGYVSAGLYETTYAFNSAVKSFSLYGTSVTEPASNIFYNGTNSDGTPNLENWTVLLDNVTVPDLLYESYSSDIENYDYDGDGVVGVDDVYYAIQNMGGLKFDIDSVARTKAVRYIRLQFHTAANETTAQEALDEDATSTDYRERFHIIEIDHSHMGCDVD